VGVVKGKAKMFIREGKGKVKGYHGKTGTANFFAQII
jgi:hypothetical protein